MVGIILQYISISNQHTEHLQFTVLMSLYLNKAERDILI